MLDGMSIRTQVTYDHHKKKMVGYVDLGLGPQEDEGEASEALVFMVTGDCQMLNHYWITCYMQ